ncbi:glycosylhydrolase family 18-9 [Colletotrichum kahawae]|uniref:Glycosylhydrolase family 18-9 n=1 Tax=Colletotrichum kahawae TaxID=34407 RepID=A0AAD9YEH1_COLKA|nr:glycosylhydrolase family 18-9 [Colletotrichum kahawae]
MSQDDKDATNIKALTSAIGRKQMDPPKFVPALPSTQEPPKIAELCRWSGCYQDCPAGFKTVQREGHKEIMLNGENCLAGGVDKLCCPSDQKMPTCQWRGHRNSGVCKPGCNDGEVKVGSLRVGCNFSHQAACCTSEASTSAYGSCKWVGEAPTCNRDCPSDYPNKIFSSKLAAGGEQPCISGTKHYCCREPKPAAFSKCDWVKKGSPRRFEQDFICEDSCPSGQIKLATEVGGMNAENGCFGGARAYCCEPPKAVVVPRGDDDPFGGNQNKEFQLLLEKYMENPTCPATILRPVLGDMFTNVKRSLEFEASLTRTLQGRATNCEMDRYVRMIGFGVVLLTKSADLIGPLQPVYDEIFAGAFDEDLTAEKLRAYYQRNPDIDPNAFMQYVFLNPKAAGPGLRRAARASETFCVLPTTRKRDEKALSVISRHPSDVAKRWVWWLPNDENGTPDISTILGGILNGDLSLHYARWQYLSNQNGPMLELAYWIGRTPGVAGGNDIYRDPDMANGGPQDRWVVFHMHIDVDTDWLRTINGRTHVGIRSIQVFHGYESNVHNGNAWRVDNTDGNRNSRDGFRCREEGALWFPGAAVQLPIGTGTESDELFFSQFQQWGERLFNDGYMGSRALELILSGFQTLSNGDIDPNNPGRIQWRNRLHPAWGQEMYEVNFLIQAAGFFFGIPEP